MQEISNFISNVGFPIAISLALLYQNNTTNNLFQKTMQHYRVTIDRNNTILKLIVDALQGKINEDDLNTIKQSIDSKGDDKDV